MFMLTDLKGFAAAIGDISKNFGKDIIVQEHKQALLQHKRYRPTAKKWAAYSYEAVESRIVHYRPIDCNLLKYCLQEYLRSLGYEFVLSGFYYQAIEMDIFSIVRDRVIEFEIKTDLTDFAADFRKVYRMGKIPVNKHAHLDAGKALPNFFYFVCPAGMLEAEDVPAHTGLIHAYFPEQRYDHKTREPLPRVPVFRIEKVAPLLHSNRIPPATYKTIASKLERRYRDIYGRHAANHFHSLPKDCTEPVNLIPYDTKEV
jgi:hypothetical protein